MLTGVNHSTRFAVAALVLIWFPACVERKEHLSISPDGAVLYQIEHKTDSIEELYQGDAVPMLAGGWMVQQQEEQDDQGRVTYTLLAEAAFGPKNKLPESYALRKDPDADLTLQFPTSLSIEQRSDGMYYHFARTYPGRSWAQIELLREGLVERPMQDFDDVPLEDWTPGQRITAVNALASFETEKALVFARAAFKHTTPQAPQDGWLGVGQHMRDCLAQMDHKSLAKLLEPKESLVEEQKRQEELTTQTKRFEEALADQFKQALRDRAGYDGSQVQQFFVEYDRQRKAYQITQDLGDDQFEITVEMPGEIVASNADSASATTAVWNLQGQMLRDREVELLVTSRLPR
jgi:hypothetical protein